MGRRIRRVLAASTLAAGAVTFALGGVAHAGFNPGDFMCFISITDATPAPEGDAGSTNATFTITKSGFPFTASVHWATADGTAQAGSDYTASSGDVVLGGAEPDVKTVNVPVTGDTAVEPDENFVVNLTMGAPCTFTDNQGSATIQNDDSAVVDPDPDPDPEPAIPTGYRLTALDGGVFCYGESTYEGGANSIDLAAPVIDIDETPDRAGYWQAGLDGGVFAWNAPFFGNALPYEPQAPILGIAARPQGDGYWLAGLDGGVFALGDAPFLGNALMEGVVIIDIVSTSTGEGYWLLDANGTVYEFGDAQHLGDHEAADVEAVGLAAAVEDTGYWIANVPGNVFEFGTATDHGQIEDPERLAGSIVTIEALASGGGYWLLGFDGGVFAFDAPFYGSAVGLPLNAPVIAMAGKA